MQAGAYRWLDRGESAILEVEDEGTVFVVMGGVPVSAFPHLEGFLAAQARSLSELTLVPIAPPA